MYFSISLPSLPSLLSSPFSVLHFRFLRTCSLRWGLHRRVWRSCGSRSPLRPSSSSGLLLLSLLLFLPSTTATRRPRFIVLEIHFSSRPPLPVSLPPFFLPLPRAAQQIWWESLPLQGDPKALSRTSPSSVALFPLSLPPLSSPIALNCKQWLRIRALMQPPMLRPAITTRPPLRRRSRQVAMVSIPPTRATHNVQCRGCPVMMQEMILGS